MANKLYSLKLKKDIERLYREGLVLKKSFLVFRFIKNEKMLRAAFRVSKKAAKSAVRRNKIKRWCKEILIKHQELGKTPHDILIIVLREPKNYENFRTKMQDLLQEMLAKNGSFSHC